MVQHVVAAPYRLPGHFVCVLGLTWALLGQGLNNVRRERSKDISAQELTKEESSHHAYLVAAQGTTSSIIDPAQLENRDKRASATVNDDGESTLNTFERNNLESSESSESSDSSENNAKKKSKKRRSKAKKKGKRRKKGNKKKGGTTRELTPAPTPAPVATPVPTPARTGAASGLLYCPPPPLYEPTGPPDLCPCALQLCQYVNSCIEGKFQNAAPEPQAACDAVYKGEATLHEEYCCHMLLSECSEQPFVNDTVTLCYYNITRGYFPSLYGEVSTVGPPPETSTAPPDDGQEDDSDSSGSDSSSDSSSDSDSDSLLVPGLQMMVKESPGARPPETLQVKKMNKTVKEQIVVIKKQNRVGKKQNGVVKIDEELAALRDKKQRTSNHSSKFPKPNRKLPALIDSSGSPRLRDPLLDRANAPTQNNLELQIHHDQSAESLDVTVLAKCTSD
jgi:hypothetical protein